MPQFFKNILKGKSEGFVVGRSSHDGFIDSSKHKRNASYPTIYPFFDGVKSLKEDGAAGLAFLALNI